MRSCLTCGWLHIVSRKHLVPSLAVAVYPTHLPVLLDLSLKVIFPLQIHPDDNV